MGNTQANSILDTIHQVIVKLIHTFHLQNNYRDEDDPWSYILSDTDFAVCSTYRTTLKATSGQMVFRHGMILNTPFNFYWVDISILKKN